MAGKLYLLQIETGLESFLSSSGGGLFGRSVTFGSRALFNFTESLDAIARYSAAQSCATPCKTDVSG